MVIAFFLIENKDGKSCFFEETFLLTDINMDVAFTIFFFTLSNVKVNFTDLELRWKLYTIAEVFLTKRQMELVKKKEFAIANLDQKNEIFVVYVTTLDSSNSDDYLFH